jgi:transcriptional regulator with XRE-family HTH domain
MIHMPSLRILITPSERAAGRFINAVRRAILKALAEEEAKRGLKQTDLARAIGVHRSVINRELRGKKDISTGRIGQLAWALGRKASFDLPEPTARQGSNVPLQNTVVSQTKLTATTATGTNNYAIPANSNIPPIASVIAN